MQIIRKKRVKKHLITWDRICWVFVIAFAVYTTFIAYTAFAAAVNEIQIEAPEPELEIVPAIVTAYTSSVDETDEDPFITASGANTKRGIIACPSKYAFGTVVEFEGVQYTCEDRMNKRYRETNRFDVWLESKAEAYNWGLKTGAILVVSREV